MARVAAFTDIGVLPRELTELVIDHVPHSALHALLQAGRMFGQLPTLDLVRSVSLDVQLLNMSQPHQSGRLGKLSNIQNLELIGNAATAAAAAAAASDLVTGAQLSHAVVLLTRHVPLMPQLTELCLACLPLSFAVAALSCLGAAAPPTLVYVRLQSLHCDLEALGCDMCQLWPALAQVTSLTRLGLEDMAASPSSEARGDSALTARDLAGVATLRTLRSLNIGSATMRLSALPALPGLTQLGLRGVHVPANAAGPSIVGFLALQDLSILENHAWQDGDVPIDLDLASVSWGQLSRLTTLKVDFPEGNELPPAMAHYLPTYTALVYLAADRVPLTCSLLQALRSLVKVKCLCIQLPAASSGVSLPTLGRICMTTGFDSPEDGQVNTLPPQAVGRTFPRLSRLSMHSIASNSDITTPLQLWPLGVTGQMLHLRSLCMYGDRFMPLPLAHAAVALTSITFGCDLPRERADVLSCLRCIGPQLLKAVAVCSLDDQSLCRLVDCCPLLHTVSIVSGSVTDVGLARLSRAPHLRTVLLHNCPSVSASGVAALASCWSVEVLKVHCCAMVSAEGIVHVMGVVGRPQLAISHL